MSSNDVAVAVNDAARAKQKLDSIVRKYAALQSKAAQQRNEVGRLTKLVEELREDNKKLLADIKWMRGEK